MDEVSHILHFEACGLKVDEFLEARNIATILVDSEAYRHNGEQNSTTGGLTPFLAPLLVGAKVESTWHTWLEVFRIREDLAANVFIQVRKSIRMVMEQISDLNHIESMDGLGEMSCLFEPFCDEIGPRHVDTSKLGEGVRDKGFIFKRRGRTSSHDNTRERA